MNPLWLYLGFFTAIGACVGSFLNVVIYRLPAGKSLVHPPSTCPRCGTRLAWYDNVPVLGWLWLRGKCRTCKLPIAFQYPVVEAVTAALFAAAFVFFYVTPLNSRFFADFAGTWPIYVVYLILFGSLIAATMIDARLYIIPIQIPRLVVIVALIALPVTAALLPATAIPAPLEDIAGYGWWTITAPTPIVDGRALAAAGGALVGLIIANVLLLKGILPLSFPTEEEQSVDDPAKAHEAEAHAKESKKQKKSKKNADTKRTKKGPPRGVMLVLALTIAIVICIAIGKVITLAIAACLLWWGMLLHGAVDEQAEEDAQNEEGPDEWLAHPSPRREMLKECLFVAFPIVGGVVGALVWNMATSGGSGTLPGALRVAGGVVMGYLVGGGFVWLIRIAGTLGFGKEAMGLGDVHLMAAVGAVIGGLDAAIATLLAAFLGIIHTAIVMGVVGLFKKRQSAIPFGPHLCGAALLMILFRDPIARILFLITGMKIG